MTSDGQEKRAGDAPDAGAPGGKVSKTPMSPRKQTLLLVAGALVALALVIVFGVYQFGRRSSGPVNLVKAVPVHGTDVTIGDGILDFIKKSGIKVVSEGFRPSWGAEQVGDSEWIVSYIFEVGRQARWASWRINTKTGTVEPVDELARLIQNGPP
ncbi:MAG: hypothetical protein ACYC99_12215 [Candidatus Geothermincolia bacterium]